MLSVFETMARTFGLTSDKLCMGNFLLDKFQELGATDTSRTAGRGDECTRDGDKDRPLVAARDTETLPIQFRVKGSASCCKGFPELRAIEVRD